MSTHPRRPVSRTGLLLLPPLLWLGVAYLGALGALFLAAFWTTNEFTGDLVKVFTLDNFRGLLEQPVYRTITVRTLGVAVLVTLVDAALALPVAFFMAKVARPGLQRLLVIAVQMPLWASYLVKAYPWRGMLSKSGPLEWLGIPPG